MNLHADLAESWTTPDPLAYVFHLRPNVRFHDGRPLTSADVKFTFEFILNRANKSPKHGGFRQIAKIDAPDSQTVIFYLNAPYASFLWRLIPSAAGIVPANASADFSLTRSTAGAMAQSRHRPRTPPARICYAALRFSARQHSAHVAALGRRQQRSRCL